ncbi:cupredoxin domain-containing protein [Collimonas silvisoli]|uniref:cupredoxin domain-containing protein n=1 Tax=Collimonas silvisoli TaxID=2825884 RepID=UPI001B8CCDC3|nr:cupredoxin family protein [Collimonas silvisoli]
MKSVLIASTLAVSLLSANAFAHGDETHNAAAEKSEGHAAALGKPGVAAKVSKTMSVDMNDNMRFTPATITIKRGETVKFIVKNSGKVKHEMVLGSIKELKEHAALMQKFPEMEHADPNQVSLEPGQSGELIWQFSKAGAFDFACLQPGHFEAGMRGKVIVK